MSTPPASPDNATRNGRRLAWGLVPLAALAFLLSTSFPQTPATPPPDTAPRPSASADRPALRRSPGARQVLRSAPSTAPHAAKAHPKASVSPEAGAVKPAEEEDSGALPEGGRQAPASVPLTPETIQAAMQESLPGIEACVDAWIVAAPPEKALEGRLTLEVVLSPEGVQEAALLDVDGVPEPMLGCIGGAVYEVAWPRPEEETTIHYPFRLIAE